MHGGMVMAHLLSVDDAKHLVAAPQRVLLATPVYDPPQIEMSTIDKNIDIPGNELLRILIQSVPKSGTFSVVTGWETQ